MVVKEIKEEAVKAIKEEVQQEIKEEAKEEVKAVVKAVIKVAAAAKAVIKAVQVIVMSTITPPLQKESIPHTTSPPPSTGRSRRASTHS